MQMYQPYNPKNGIKTPYLFFTGKGGVGKTSTACATAVSLADQGKRVLLVSTDPASNLQDVLDMELTNKIVPVSSVGGLYACNLDPEEAASAYREQVVGPYRGQLPDSVIASMEEQLSGACTVEIAAFDEFTKLLGNAVVADSYDHIIFDTAPTGHTLRLLQLPSAWSGFLEESTHGASCLGPLSGLGDKKEVYSKTVKELSDSSRTTLILVSRPDASSLHEAGRASLELKEIGIQNQMLLINGLLQTHLPDDEVSAAFYLRQRRALQEMPDVLRQAVTYSLPYVSYSLTGVQNLRCLFNQYTLPVSEAKDHRLDSLSLQGLNEVVEDFSQKGTRVIFAMGKGGVGKTTVASAIAVGLADKGHRVHLTTTDPAAHLEYMFKQSKGTENLSISRIHPGEEVEKYKREVLLKAGSELDEEGIAYLKEDLDSPCTEEIAVFRAFAELVHRSEQEIVVIDTAPTGHTLLLLDSAEAYHKEMSRSSGDIPESVKKLLPRLKNPNETGVVIVTLAEATPVIEAGRLQADLKRAKITPQWWVINQSLYAAHTKDPVLNGRAQSEKEWIKRVTADFSSHTAIIPWMKEEKFGYEKLKDFLTLK